MANQIYPMRGGDGQNFHPMRLQQGRNVGTAVPQNFDNVRNKISDLNTAIHALNPRFVTFTDFYIFFFMNVVFFLILFLHPTAIGPQNQTNVCYHEN